MGKAIIREKVGEEGLYLVTLEYETKTSDIRYIEATIDKLMEELKATQAEIEADTVEDQEEDPAKEEDPEEEDPDPEEDEDPSPSSDPEPGPPEPEPPPEESGQISGTVKGFI